MDVTVNAIIVAAVLFSLYQPQPAGACLNRALMCAIHQ